MSKQFTPAVEDVITKYIVLNAFKVSLLNNNKLQINKVVGFKLQILGDFKYIDKYFNCC